MCRTLTQLPQRYPQRLGAGAGLAELPDQPAALDIDEADVTVVMRHQSGPAVGRQRQRGALERKGHEVAHELAASEVPFLQVAAAGEEAILLRQEHRADAAMAGP